MGTHPNYWKAKQEQYDRDHPSREKLPPPNQADFAAQLARSCEEENRRFMDEIKSRFPPPAGEAADHLNDPLKFGTWLLHNENHLQRASETELTLLHGRCGSEITRLSSEGGEVASAKPNSPLGHVLPILYWSQAAIGRELTRRQETERQVRQAGARRMKKLAAAVGGLAVVAWGIVKLVRG